MPRAGAVPGFVVAVVAIVVGAALAYWVGSKRERDKTAAVVEPAAEWSILTSESAFLAERCRTESGFDPETSHWADYEVEPGLTVTIVPHMQSNKHSLAGLGRGKVVAKFVNKSPDREYRPLALAANGQSCLFIQSTKRPDAEEDQLVARAIAAGAEMERTFKSFHIDFHDSAHKTPLARWYDGTGRIVTAQAGAGALNAIFRLAAFPAVAQGDSTGGSGPSAWVTCVSNGCCRMGMLDE